MMSLVIKGITLPKNEDGTYWVPSYEVKGVEIGAIVLTIMIDQKTQRLSASVWNPEAFKLRERNYDCIEIHHRDDLISRVDAIIDANERACDFWCSNDEADATIQFLKEQTAIIPADTVQELLDDMKKGQYE